METTRTPDLALPEKATPEVRATWPVVLAVLAVVTDHPGHPISIPDLAVRSGHTKSSVTDAANALAALGWVDKKLGGRGHVPRVTLPTDLATDARALLTQRLPLCGDRPAVSITQVPRLATASRPVRILHLVYAAPGVLGRVIHQRVPMSSTAGSRWFGVLVERGWLALGTHIRGEYHPVPARADAVGTLVAMAHTYRAELPTLAVYHVARILLEQPGEYVPTAQIARRLGLGASCVVPPLTTMVNQGWADRETNARKTTVARIRADQATTVRHACHMTHTLWWPDQASG
jgi:hypothetical protein